MKFRFIKLSQNKSFDYKPMYYNPQKEELQQRIDRAKREAGSTDQPYTPNIKGQFKPVFNREMRTSERKSNIRLVIIIAVLMGVAYWLLSDFHDVLF